MTASARPGSVFISYKREEAAFAETLRKALVKEGFNVWWDEDLQCGQAWAEKLDEAIRDATCIIVLWSEKSVASQWVRHEASQAIAREVYAPCRISLVQLDSPYDRIQATDLLDWDGDSEHAGFQNLLQRVDTLVPAPVPLPSRIAYWLRANPITVVASGIALFATWLLVTIFLALQADRLEKAYDCSASAELRTELAIARHSSGESLRSVCLRRTDLSDVDLSKADLSRANLREASLLRATLEGANLRLAELGGANLSEANLKRADLSWADLREAFLTDAGLNKANLSSANLSRARLVVADLREAFLVRADLSNADLAGADLREAVLPGADLSEANLFDADLSGAKLFDANLIEADLRGANLRGAYLSRANLRTARFSPDTKWPENYDPEAAGAVLIEDVPGPSPPSQLEPTIPTSPAQ
jgi:uncharacterized protein YjbI with pentapeptide repeats